MTQQTILQTILKDKQLQLSQFDQSDIDELETTISIEN